MPSSASARPIVLESGSTPPSAIAITLKGAAAASVALTVRDIGEAPPVPRKKKGAAPPPGKLSAVVRAKRGVTYYK